MIMIQNFSEKLWEREWTVITNWIWKIYMKNDPLLWA